MFLSGADLGRISQTCHQFREAAAHPMLWQQLLLRDYAGARVLLHKGAARQLLYAGGGAWDARSAWLLEFHKQRCSASMAAASVVAQRQAKDYALGAQDCGKVYEACCVRPCLTLFAMLVMAFTVLLCVRLDQPDNVALSAVAAPLLGLGFLIFMLLATPFIIVVVSRACKSRDHLYSIPCAEVAVHRFVPWRHLLRHPALPPGYVGHQLTRSTCRRYAWMTTVALCVVVCDVLLALKVWAPGSGISYNAVLLPLWLLLGLLVACPALVASKCVCVLVSVVHNA